MKTVYDIKTKKQLTQAELYDYRMDIKDFRTFDMTDAEAEELIEAGKTIMIDFWAPYCNPCMSMTPILEAVAEKSSNVQIIKINIDDNQELISKYNVRSIPTFILFKDKNEIKRRSAACTQAVLTTFLAV